MLLITHGGDVERENVNISLSFDELLKFEDFDNLYYLGLT